MTTLEEARRRLQQAQSLRDVRRANLAAAQVAAEKAAAELDEAIVAAAAAHVALVAMQGETA
jgi:hypothetical protein